MSLSGQTTEWARVESGIDPARYQVEQLWFNSKDGTRVPMFVVSKKGLVKNGRNPTLLSGYGGFNVGRTPFFNRNVMLLLLEAGGVYVDVQLRGGNEFGEDWHRNGMLEKKQNVFDDFIAAAEHLIAEKYTDAEHLAIQGGSNGGLLMGAALTQRPDLFRAVVCQVPLLDMLRYQNFQIAKLWIPEYGSSDDPQQFEYLRAYSPYHQVKAGTQYPAVLFMTAESDTRVDPMHAVKMAALLQAEAANGPRAPDPAARGCQSRTWSGQANRKTGGRRSGCVEFFVLAAWRKAIDHNRTWQILISFPIANKEEPLTAPYYLNRSEKSLARIERLRQPETKTAFGNKSHFFFSCGISSRGASGRAHCGSDSCTFAAAHQCTQQRATAGSAANERQVAFLVTAATHKHAVGLQRHGLAIQRDGRKRDPQIAGIMHVSGFAGGNYLAGNGRAFGRQRLSFNYKRFVQFGGKVLPGLRCRAGNRLLQPHVNSGICRDHERLAFNERQLLLRRCRRIRGNSRWLRAHTATCCQSRKNQQNQKE